MIKSPNLIMPYKKCAMKLKKMLLIIIPLFIIISCNKNDVTGNESVTITLRQTSISLVVDGREKLFLITDPVDTDVSNLTWSSSDTAIAKVDEMGVVNAISVGKATITMNGVENNSGQCVVTVTESPITNLIMPEVKFPIAKDVIFPIQGTGFTASSKIWFHKIAGSGSLLKSGESSDGILATIHEQAENYILLVAGVSDGWYSISLEQDETYYNLGNIEVETPEIGAYEYDASKIIWDDTHWRRCQLRGKVKEMTVTKNFTNTISDVEHFTFNEKGYIVAFNDGEAGDSVNIEYDNENRPTLQRVYYATGKNTYYYKYTYGDHNLYYPIETQFFVFNEYYNCFYGLEFTSNNREIWVKGLSGIKYDNPQDLKTSSQIEISSNAVTETYHTSYNYDYKTIYNYSGLFPETGSITGKKTSETKWDTVCSKTFEYVSTGYPVEYTTTYINDGSKYCSHFVQNTPFYLYSDNESPFASGRETYNYDSNWNLTDFNEYEDDKFYSHLIIVYTSYDAVGNWTSCYIKKCNEENLVEQINTVTRDITYW